MFRSVNLLRVVPLSACVVTLLSLSRGYGQPSTLPSSTSSWPADATGLRLHMIGNAHIDAVWLWTWPEADAVAHSTFRSALDRLNEDPEITMTTSSSQFYEWIADRDPGLLAKIKQRVQEGRWDMVGGWWDAPDV